MLSGVMGLTWGEWILEGRAYPAGGDPTDEVDFGNLRRGGGLF